MHLTLRQLSTFREVMRAGSISQAARSLGRTQPAVSATIATLEAELGFALFVREHGRLSPTPEARYLLEEAEAVLARLERTRQTLGRVRALQSGSLRIACHPAASGRFLPRLLTGFLEQRRDVRLSLIMRSSAVIEDLIASQQFDIGFAETPAPRASIAQTDFDLECVCVLRADDPLAARDVLTPDDLDGRPMAVLFEEHPTATGIEAAFARAGRRIRRHLELRTNLPGLHFVAAGHCYMVCDMITAYSHLRQVGPPGGRLTIRRFRPRIGSDVSILTPAFVSQARLARAFCDHLTGAIRAMQDEVESYLAHPTPTPPAFGADAPPEAGNAC